MNNFPKLKGLRSLEKPQLHCVFLALAVLLLCGGGTRVVSAQVAPEGQYGRPHLYAGGGVSGFNLQYGDHNNGGITAFVDADTAHHIGLEAEGRWLDYRETADVHAETYLAGLRYHLGYRKFQPYVKCLVGKGDFNFPYNYATGSYFVIAPGGGLDYALNHRWSARADFEYQDWPQFTFGTMDSIGVTIGIRYRIF